MNFIRFLKRDLAVQANEWVKEGIIEKEQAQKILARYGSKLPTDEKKGKHGLEILTSIGAIFIGIAFILLISYNWNLIPRALRMSAVITINALIHLLGIYYFKMNLEMKSKGFFIFGNFTFGVSIFLIAQIYHLGEHFPDGILYWILGTIPISIITGGLPIIFLEFFKIVLWTFTEIAHGFVPWVLPIFLIISLWYSWCKKSSTIIFLGSILLGITYIEIVITRFLPYSLQHINLAHFGMASAFMVGTFCFGSWYVNNKNSLPHIREYGEAMRIWSIRYALFALFVLSFEKVWKELLHSSSTTLLVHKINLVSGIVALVICAFYTKLIYQTENKVILKKIIPSLSLSFLLFFIPLLIIFGNFDRQHYLPFQLVIIINILLVVIGIWLILTAINRHQGAKLYLGVGVLGLLALFRYFDLMGGSYLGGSFLFCVEGIILIITANLWKKYRNRSISREQE